jgi:hypothetical protein
MSIELIGLVSVLVGVLVLYHGPNFGIYAVTISTLFGAAAIAKLPSLGSANIAPVHAILVPYVITVFRCYGFKPMLRTLAFPSPGFWAALFVVFCAITAVLMPRIFSGTVDVLSMTRSENGRSGLILMPLVPRPGNITQSLYLVADLLLFAAVATHAMGGAINTIVRAVLIAAICNLGFAGLDVATYVTGTGDLLSIIRNANYAMQVDVAIGNFKRVVGSFTEASAFGGFTLLFFAFSLELWLQNKFRKLAGPVALLSLVAIIAATSSATYVGLAIYGMVLWVRCAFTILQARATTRGMMIALLVPPAVLSLAAAAMLIPSVADTVLQIVDSTLVNKLNTQSGIERWYWNENGLRVFYETGMLGAGVGSVRTSSLFVALLANVGIPGLVFFIAFIASLCLAAWRGSSDPDIGVYATASAWSGFTIVISAVLAASGIDLGLFFFILAAIVSATLLSASPVASPARMYAPFGRQEDAYGY